MSKKYHLDQNNVAFIHCINSCFAGLYTYVKLLDGSKKIPKKKMLKVLADTIAQTNTALTSEYIRGELIKKGVLENGDDTGLCTFDPLVDNKNSETEVYTQDELKAIQLEQQKPTWTTDVKGK